MRFGKSMFGAALMAASALGLAAAAAPSVTEAGRIATLPGEARSSAAKKSKKMRALASGSHKRFRSKNSPTQRKLKSNRLTISRRVRRKHRRAA
jgi:hypothetical protein